MKIVCILISREPGITNPPPNRRPLSPVSQELREKDAHREFGYLLLRDGVKLSYVIYRPTEGDRHPTLLEFSPYGVDGFEFSQVKRYLERGYPYAGVSIRGGGGAALRRHGASAVSPGAGRARHDGRRGALGL